MFATPTPRSRRETIEDVTKITVPASNENQRDVTPPPRSDHSETAPALPRVDLNQRYVTPPPRRARSETTPPPLPREATPPPRNDRFEQPLREDLRQIEAWFDFNGTADEARFDLMWRQHQPLEDWMPRIPQANIDPVTLLQHGRFQANIDPLTLLQQWQATDPASISRFCQILRQIDPAPRLTIYSVRGMSGQMVQVRLPEATTAGFLRGPLAELVNFQRFAENPSSAQVFPYQIRLYVDSIELNYSEPAPIEALMIVDPSMFEDFVHVWERIYKMFGRQDLLEVEGSAEHDFHTCGEVSLSPCPTWDVPKNPNDQLDGVASLSHVTTVPV